MKGPRRLNAMLAGIVAGGIAISTALLMLRAFTFGVLFEDIVGFGLGVIVAPIAASAAAMVMRATTARVFTTAGLALLLAFTIANVVDYGLTALLLVPDAPGGPYQGKPALTERQVAQIAETWILGRHVVLCAIGLVGGAALGAWRGAVPAVRRGRTRLPAAR